MTIVYSTHVGVRFHPYFQWWTQLSKWQGQQHQKGHQLYVVEHRGRTNGMGYGVEWCGVPPLECDRWLGLSVLIVYK